MKLQLKPPPKPRRNKRVTVLLTKEEVRAIKKHLGGDVSLSGFLRDKVIEQLRKETVDE
jgi:hypothetical protein